MLSSQAPVSTCAAGVKVGPPTRWRGSREGRPGAWQREAGLCLGLPDTHWRQWGPGRGGVGGSAGTRLSSLLLTCTYAAGDLQGCQGS